MKVKPWQMAVIVLGLLVGGGSLAYNVVNSGSVDLADSIYLVDAETGKLYKFPMSSAASIILPARRPDTKQIALVRVVKDKDGQWHVTERDLSQLDNLDQGIKHDAIDPHTGKLLKTAGGPDRYTPPSLP